MKEMEFIKKCKSLNESSKEQWIIKRVNILEQAKLESSRHTCRFADVFPSDEGNDDLKLVYSVVDFSPGCF